MAGDARADEVLRRLERAPDALVCIVGPTASGKTALAVELAERARGEILTADSVQVYRGFDVGAGKPTAEERARATHHFVDLLDPVDAMDAAAFAALAEAKIADLRAAGKTPIVCGGTFFWVRALVLGLVDAPKADEATRARHRAIVLAEGRQALHARLAAVDPESAARLHPNDAVRVGRALEVFELTGRPMSSWHAEHGFRARRHEALLFGVTRESGELDERIRARAATFLDAGWIDEVRGLVARGHGDARAMGSVGYREVKAHVDGTLGAEELLPAIVASTRQFARRQRTWLARADVTWLG